MPFPTPQDTEDAFYDALEQADAEALRLVWETSPAIACLLPMMPLVTGEAVHALWKDWFARHGALDLQTRHLAWINGEDFALHLLEERTSPRPGQPPAPSIYTTHLFRKSEAGWCLLLHQNSPTPPDPALLASAPFPARS